ncbi:class I SAM-dependent methyltransferase [Mesonia maritima]|uniref:O-methyltransferase involved in polyketide biosynthesis n=1 Tax=Mesonia maritima TaxID=1793873 RepID=A0ABU1K4E4_9FLAO|nr:class I SAM-dependent methyltransferase [Mesonia maritima]MDR6300130.1 O-methyltransferase involved in polyketide biosynthesis [Mesonia maritima]
MEKEQHIKIHETAFVTSTFRAFDENLSQDHFAKLWENLKTTKWINEYLELVSAEEPFTHCLRNRYFLETLQDLIEQQEIEVVINFGSGFSMYPFLLHEKIIHIEIDKPEIVDYKKKKIEEWENEHKIPKRNIHFMGVDFSKDYQKELLSEIQSIKRNKSTFILIEGVLFFLTRAETNKLFDFFNSIQENGDYLGSASFQETIKETQAFENLLRFFNQKVSKTTEDDYQTIQDNYYHSIKNYKVIDHQDYFSLSKKYKHRINQPKELILNENFYLLKKN